MSVSVDRRAQEHFPAPCLASEATDPYLGLTEDELWAAFYECSGRAAQELVRRGVGLPTVDRDPVWLR